MTQTFSLESEKARSIMVNNTSHGNSTTTKSSSGGLAAGLTILLLAVIGGVIVYKYRREIMTKLQLRKKRRQKTADSAEPPQAVPHQYSSMGRLQSTAPQPIYENLSAQTTASNKHTVNTAHQRRLSDEPEEDLYLQCDSAHDAIYSNDPACNLSILPDRQEEEEDVYIVPDS